MHEQQLLAASVRWSEGLLIGLQETRAMYALLVWQVWLWAFLYLAVDQAHFCLDQIDGHRFDVRGFA
ncbi:hypothetical protein PSH85_00870 [Pseudomonas simiae]|uniref:hypothetical protein n=1 Tax=Pseudomonas simiae TaxID=321846 RepID=UPI0027354852|nr:hypothetical protein [Pseudomonas simiae]WLG34344.1 hypothetical protein PSH82_00870 [Pseudomonas simiae]WLI24304.1 hypothetical protein PSH85_00870 [Pseudomonas simiae]